MIPRYLRREKEQLQEKLDKLERQVEQGEVTREEYLEEKHDLLDGRFEDDVLQEYDNRIEQYRTTRNLALLGLAITAIAALITFFPSGITGFATGAPTGGNASFNTLGVGANVTGNHTLTYDFINATSLRASGTVYGQGETWIYLKTDTGKQLVYYTDTRATAPTGNVVANPTAQPVNGTNVTTKSNATNASTANTSANRTGSNTTNTSGTNTSATYVSDNVTATSTNTTSNETNVSTTNTTSVNATSTATNTSRSNTSVNTTSNTNTTDNTTTDANVTNTSVNETSNTTANTNSTSNATNDTNTTSMNNTSVQNQTDTNTTIQNTTETNTTSTTNTDTNASAVYNITVGDSYKVGDIVHINVTPNTTDTTLYMHTPTDTYLLQDNTWNVTETGKHRVTGLFTTENGTERRSATFHAYTDVASANFTDTCVETCTISESSVTLVVQANNTRLELHNISYTTPDENTTSTNATENVSDNRTGTNTSDGTQESNTSEQGSGSTRQPEGKQLGPRPCLNDNPNLRPRRCFTQDAWNDRFPRNNQTLINDQGDTVAMIDYQGNLHIDGNVYENTTATPKKYDFVIKNENERATIWIDAVTKDLHVTGEVKEEQETLKWASREDYIVSNSEGMYLAVFRANSGDLLLRGSVRRGYR